MPFETIVIEKVQAPDELLRQCRTPDLEVLETTGDLEQALGEAVVSLQTCNQDKERIKEWMASP